jgi:hypothetical protein
MTWVVLTGLLAHHLPIHLLPLNVAICVHSEIRTCSCLCGSVSARVRINTADRMTYSQQQNIAHIVYHSLTALKAYARADFITPIRSCGRAGEWGG